MDLFWFGFFFQKTKGLLQDGKEKSIQDQKIQSQLDDYESLVGSLKQQSMKLNEENKRLYEIQKDQQKMA